MDTQKLIEMITRQVLASVKDASGAIEPAKINPPLGTCTGDYSKFNEKVGESGNGGNGGGGGGGVVPVGGPVLSGFVTARMLEEAGVAVVRLADGARLTPAAQDYVKEKKLGVERAAADGSAGVVGAPGGDWLWWTDGNCPAVKQLTGELKSKMAKLTPAAKSSELAAAVSQGAKRVRAGNAAGVILFVDSGALAGCFANRCPSLRAVVGTCGQATCQGVNQLGANTLILEYPHHGYRAMSQMLDTFMNTPRPNLDAVDRQLQELSRCV